MRIQRLLLGLTLLNLALLLYVFLSRTAPLLATESSQILRGSALEIVDARGRVRASIKLQPAETLEPAGKNYPETVMLRLIDAKGRPEVKIGASEVGGGLSLLGNTDATQILLQADGAQTSLRLKNQTGQEQLIRP